MKQNWEPYIKGEPVSSRIEERFETVQPKLYQWSDGEMVLLDGNGNYLAGQRSVTLKTGSDDIPVLVVEFVMPKLGKIYEQTDEEIKS